MKRTKKFIAAEKIALKIGIKVDDNIYQNLKKQGLVWFKVAGEWLTEKYSDPSIPIIEVRVAGNKKTIEDDCRDIIESLHSSFVVEGMSKAYPCRSPQEHKSQIYLRIIRRK